MSLHTREGGLYRIDLRLRPFGSSGALVMSETDLLSYYRKDARLWEFQALLKLRPVAGNLKAGEAFTRRLQSEGLNRFTLEEIRSAVEDQRNAALDQAGRKNKGIDVKNGPGGLRDIEFLLQGLQLAHGGRLPEILTGNTLAGLDRIAAAGLVPQKIGEDLKASYRFLRRLEHFLQIFEDRQIHRLPLDASELSALGRRIAPQAASGEAFLALAEETMRRNREIRSAYL